MAILGPKARSGKEGDFPMRSESTIVVKTEVMRPQNGWASCKTWIAIVVFQHVTTKKHPLAKATTNEP